MFLNQEDSVWAADKFIDFYSSFEKVTDYLTGIKKKRNKYKQNYLFGLEPEHEMFGSDSKHFDIHPKDMNFEIHNIGETENRKYSNFFFHELLNLTTSHAITDSVPGRSMKWIVEETNTGKVVGMIRMGSPVFSIKPRNVFLGETNIPLDYVNKHFVMGFIIVPTQPFGYNYLGGKLMTLLASSKKMKEMFDEKYESDLKYFETTSLYGTTKGMSMYDGLKPFLRHKGDTVSRLLPSLMDTEFSTLFNWFNYKNNGEPIVPPDAPSRKMRATQKMISVIKNSLKTHDNLDKLNEFTKVLEGATDITENKRYYIGDFRHTDTEGIEWWRRKAVKRFEKLHGTDRWRTEQELWKTGHEDIDIIR